MKLNFNLSFGCHCPRTRGVYLPPDELFGLRCSSSFPGWSLAWFLSFPTRYTKEIPISRPFMACLCSAHLMSFLCLLSVFFFFVLFILFCFDLLFVLSTVVFFCLLMFIKREKNIQWRDYEVSILSHRSKITPLIPQSGFMQ